MYARLILITGVLALIAGCGPQQQDGADSPDAAAPVETVRVELATFEHTASGIGTLRAAETVQVRPEISRRIEEIRYEEGNRVEKGDVLFMLDRSKLDRQMNVSRARLALAKAQLEFARTTYQRYRALTKDGVATQERLDEVKSNFEQSQAEVERWQAEVELNLERLQDTRIVAPFDGIADDRRVDVGQLVDPGTVLTTLYRTSELEARFSLPERYVGQVETGQEARIRVDAYPDRTFDGPITFVGPNIDQSTRTFPVKATLDNEEGTLKPGTFITATVVLEEHADQPALPEEALVATREGYIVFVIEDGKAREQPVEIGLRQAGRVEIHEGLQEGDVVVRTGHMDLTPGEKVRIEGQETQGGGSGS